MEIEAGLPRNFEEVPRGELIKVDSSGKPVSRFYEKADPSLIDTVAKFTSPLAGASTETLGLDPKAVEMLPAPSCLALSATAEMAELYWMALLRDAPLLAFQKDVTPSRKTDSAAIEAHDDQLKYGVSQRVGDASRAVEALYRAAVQDLEDPGHIRSPLDLAANFSTQGIDRQSLFRSGLPDEEYGPLISQFFIQPIGYGVQKIDQTQVPYSAMRDFLTSYDDWLLAQDTGKDKYGRDYGSCNYYNDQVKFGVIYYPTEDGSANGKVIKRHISTMRDLARFVNRDALHQAYFNAALFLLGVNAPLDSGSPYRGNRYTREGGFATLGGPDLLTLVSEVASRALKVVWRQKWLVHRRCRPEVMGGLLHMQIIGLADGDPKTKNYGLPISVEGNNDYGTALEATLDAVKAHNEAMSGEESLFLPMAFSAGSPPHPAYGAGHATVAGACVTVLKAWFDEGATLEKVYAKAIKDGPKDPPLLAEPIKVLQPGYRKVGGDLEAFHEPDLYTGNDWEKMTIGGELNKIASNVAMGRSMGGVHWRSDNTRSLRLGEDVAIEIIRKRTVEYAERPVSFTFRSFDGQRIHITKGQVTRS